MDAKLTAPDYTLIRLPGIPNMPFLRGEGPTWRPDSRLFHPDGLLCGSTCQKWPFFPTARPECSSPMTSRRNVSAEIREAAARGGRRKISCCYQGETERVFIFDLSQSFFTKYGTLHLTAITNYSSRSSIITAGNY